MCPFNSSFTSHDACSFSLCVGCWVGTTAIRKRACKLLLFASGGLKPQLHTGSFAHGLSSDLPVNAAPSAFFLVKENAKATFGVRNSSCDNLARARYSTTLIAC